VAGKPPDGCHVSRLACVLSQGLPQLEPPEQGRAHTVMTTVVGSTLACATCLPWISLAIACTQELKHIAERQHDEQAPLQRPSSDALLVLRHERLLNARLMVSRLGSSCARPCIPLLLLLPFSETPRCTPNTHTHMQTCNLMR